MRKRRLGVLTGGGDCAGINSAIKWVVKTALDPRLEFERSIQYEVLGIRNGWRGLIFADPTTPDFQGYVTHLDQEIVRTWDRYGGTFLGTSRTNPYNSEHDQSEAVLHNIERLGLDALIAIGGDDTLGVAHKLAQQGVNVVGIPKTIDKDLAGTDYTLGFESALNVITEEVDRLRNTAGSHSRIFVVETMGRNAGWLALEAGESSGVYIILIPEHDFSIEQVNELVLEGRRSGARYEILVAAEGAKPKGSIEFTTDADVDGFGHERLGGVAEFVSREITKGTGMESRSIVLSHLQRGGAPCAYDRRMGRYFGIAAIDLVVKGDFGKMVSYKGGRITDIPLDDVIGKSSLVNVETQYDTERYNGRRTILESGARGEKSKRSEPIQR